MTPAVVHCGFGALLVLISVPLVLRWVPMNGVYGFRIPQAFESERHWYEINAYGGKLFLAYGILLTGFGLVFRDQAPPPRTPGRPCSPPAPSCWPCS